jgi:hypothetical protein
VSTTIQRKPYTLPTQTSHPHSPLLPGSTQLPALCTLPIHVQLQSVICRHGSECDTSNIALCALLVDVQDRASLRYGCISQDFFFPPDICLIQAIRSRLTHSTPEPSSYQNNCTHHFTYRTATTEHTIAYNTGNTYTYSRYVLCNLYTQ